VEARPQRRAAIRYIGLQAAVRLQLLLFPRGTSKVPLATFKTLIDAKLELHIGEHLKISRILRFFFGRKLSFFVTAFGWF
jgi:hypothetical protein